MLLLNNNRYVTSFLTFFRSLKNIADFVRKKLEDISQRTRVLYWHRTTLQLYNYVYLIKIWLFWVRRVLQLRSRSWFESSYFELCGLSSTLCRNLPFWRHWHVCTFFKFFGWRRWHVCTIDLKNHSNGVFSVILARIVKNGCLLVTRLVGKDEGAMLLFKFVHFKNQTFYNKANNI